MRVLCDMCVCVIQSNLIKECLRVRVLCDVCVCPTRIDLIKPLPALSLSLCLPLSPGLSLSPCLSLSLSQSEPGGSESVRSSISV